jgi:hypothetical protein
MSLQPASTYNTCVTGPPPMILRRVTKGIGRSERGGINRKAQLKLLNDKYDTATTRRLIPLFRGSDVE